MTNKETSVADFITKDIVKKPTDNKDEPVEYDVANDVFNYQGVSLLETLKSLWQAIQDYDLHATEDKTKIQYYYQLLTTFPFHAVSISLNDYMRKMMRNALGKMYLAYTTKQDNGISNLRQHYPVDEVSYKIVRWVKEESQTFIKEMEGIIEKKTIIYQDNIVAGVDRIVAGIYKIRDEHLWVVASDVVRLLTLAKQLLNKSTTRIDVVEEFLANKLKDNHLLSSFNEQIVKDISDTISFKDPHPEVYLALENGQKVLRLFYTIEDASKLFINDVESKIQQYLDRCKNQLDSQLIDYFRQGKDRQIDPDTKPEDLPIDIRYKRFLTALDKYRATGEGLQFILEEGHVFKQFSYDEVYHLANFADNMKYITALIRSQAEAKDKEGYVKVTNQPIVTMRADSKVGQYVKDEFKEMDNRVKAVEDELQVNVSSVQFIDRVQSARIDEQQNLLSQLSNKFNTLSNKFKEFISR